MKKEISSLQTSKDKHLAVILVQGGVFLALLGISLASFDKRVSRLLKERANGFCDGCKEHVGKENLIASHLIHGVKNNSPENGRALCPYCEAEYHLSHVGNAQSIGLKEKDNYSVCYGHVHQLPPFDQDILIQRYSEKWQRVLKKLDKDY
ncbi:hypothetical protein LRY65_03755 [Candidatus Woesebacteria bacterium]|nr:hypothetical protein [Candidatus Woesebacteria bacterium]MCD8507006.1 hypothetical protein [Candidatus Woesebacteria bacterium]MCD8527297.1 hypothetical protein [Candidatus Woesebacteria bacterium]MCD8546662.1 hypothetical protein [Candidatus Woesebacteria bacterium]